LKTVQALCVIKKPFSPLSAFCFAIHLKARSMSGDDWKAHWRESENELSF
jgi:hypothetical protein